MDRTLQTVTNLLQSFDRDVLVAHFQAMEGRMGKTSFPRKLLIGQISTLFSKECSELI